MRTIVVAYNERFVIGNNLGKVPWHIPEDLKFFKEATMGKACVMGRKTWESIPEKYRPLPGRLNIIVSRDPFMVSFPENTGSGTFTMAMESVEDAIKMGLTRKLVGWKDDEANEVCITGGGEIYRYCINNGLVDRVLASEIKNHLDVDGATYFPDLKALGWHGEIIREHDDFNVVEYTK